MGTDVRPGLASTTPLGCCCVVQGQYLNAVNIKRAVVF